MVARPVLEDPVVGDVAPAQHPQLRQPQRPFGPGGPDRDPLEAGRRGQQGWWQRHGPHHDDPTSNQSTGWTILVNRLTGADAGCTISCTTSKETEMAIP